MPAEFRITSLRRAVKQAAGQDVGICRACLECEVEVPDEMDIPLGSLIQLALQDDPEALDCRTLWSEAVLKAARGACKLGLDLPAVLLALRGEAARRRQARGICPDA